MVCFMHTVSFTRVHLNESVKTKMFTYGEHEEARCLNQHMVEKQVYLWPSSGHDFGLSPDSPPGSPVHSERTV